MSIELLSLLTRFDTVNDRESKTAFFRTHVPWVAEFGYLHIIFKPLQASALHQAAARLDLPSPVFDFLRQQNGAILFSGALSIFGVHPGGQLLNRKDPFGRMPFDIESENYNSPPVNQHLLAVGGYGYNGANVCIDKRDSKLYLFQRENGRLAKAPYACWDNLEDWIVGEINRLSAIFDVRGKRLVAESQTVPCAEGNA
jgi:hypothetical protein